LNLVIDIGNTATKLAIFESDELIEKRQLKSLGLDKLKNLFGEYAQIKNSILCSVINHPLEIEQFLMNHSNFIYFNFETKIPLKNKYLTPETLGKDRLAAAIGANEIFPNQNVLCIDVGTCIKYDFLNSDNEYLGGAISPGITMRYRSLKHFTDKLPLITYSSDETLLIGRNTEESIRSGVQLGVIAEINQTLENYHSIFPDIKTVLTGGGSTELQKHLKKDIFASPNLILKGLNNVLKYNFSN
jgi:type III pantothenate kinase